MRTTTVNPDPTTAPGPTRIVMEHPDGGMAVVQRFEDSAILYTATGDSGLVSDPDTLTETVAQLEQAGFRRSRHQNTKTPSEYGAPDVMRDLERAITGLDRMRKEIARLDSIAARMMTKMDTDRRCRLLTTEQRAEAEAAYFALMDYRAELYNVGTPQ